MVAMALGLAALSPISAGAKSLGLLTRMLIPGYVAQDFAELCTLNDPQFSPKLAGGWPSAAAFAQHLKIEITIGLTQSEAMNVMIAAANTALTVARKQLQDLSGPSPQNTDASIKAWCNAAGEPFILGVIERHTKEHDVFDHIIETAKH